MKSDSFQKSPFASHPLLRSGHAQTVYAGFGPAPTIAYSAVQHIVRLDDGDAVVLHDDRPAKWQPGDRVVALIHGVAGCHRSPYLVRTAAKLNQQGFRTFRLDLRGMGAGRELAQLPGHAGRSGDVRAAAGHIASVCDGSPISLVGYSMGGNLILKLAGESDSTDLTPIDSAIAVSPPIKLADCSRRLDTGIRRLYSRGFARMLMRLLRDREQMTAKMPDILATPPRGLWEFDDRFTAPASGFKGAADYYEQSSASRTLSQITLPALIVAADNDPLIPVEIFLDASYSPSTQLHITRGGGHIGFCAARGSDPDRWWLDWRIVESVSAFDQAGKYPAVGCSSKN